MSEKKKKLYDSNTSMTVPFRKFHHGQAQVRDLTARFKVVACGRRWGKTELGKTILLHQAIEEKKRAWWLAPTHLMASQVWRDLKASARRLPDLATSESERRIDVPGGGMIAVRSTHYPDNLRGEGLDLAVLDEAAYMEPRVWPEIVRPMLTTTRGSALFLSTPFGRNWFYDLFQKGINARYQPEWQSFWFPTDRNPNIAAEELESIRRMTTEHIWGAEYRARFDDDSGQVFRGIRAALARDPYSQAIAGRLYVAGVDWGRDRDYTVIVIIDAEERRMVALDRFNQIGWGLQRGRLRAICDRWGPQQIWAEANSFGSPNIEALLEEGLPMRSFTTTSKSKSPLIESLALAIERQFISLLEHPVLLAELASYTLQRLPGGGYRYGAPPGMHDDTVMATALAWHGVEKRGSRIGFA